MRFYHNKDAATRCGVGCWIVFLLPQICSVFLCAVRSALMDGCAAIVRRNL